MGVSGADLNGTDQRVLQAAVDYVAGLGRGAVEIGAGEYVMRDSLHLRSGVTVRGQGAKTVLRKARGAVSPLLLDGDYGEEQVTLAKPEGFEVGGWDSNSGRQRPWIPHHGGAYFGEGRQRVRHHSAAERRLHGECRGGGGDRVSGRQRV